MEPGHVQNEIINTNETYDSIFHIVYYNFAVPDTETLMAMKKREHTLQHTKLAQRAFSLPCADRRAISYYIQLRYIHA